MNETAARRILLLRAFETQAGGSAWTDADQTWANRATLESVPIPITSRHAESAEDFVARRAALALPRLAERDPQAARLDRALRWRSWVAPLLTLVAFCAGLASHVLGADSRINLLAPPLIGILLWNLAIYLGLIASVAGAPFRRRTHRAGPLQAAIARLAHATTGVPGDSGPHASFVDDWLQASRRLTIARVGAMLHFAAAALAAGALAMLYVRGLAFEYRAGWESTFLDASVVKNLLILVLGPASTLAGIALPDTEGVAALRFPGSENAADWIHLYALTLGLFVIVPRVLLGTLQALRARRLAGRFPLALEGHYFEALRRLQQGEATRVVVAPYSFNPTPESLAVLERGTHRALGIDSSLQRLPSVPFGGEDDPITWDPMAPVGIALALFNLSATPEHENHGIFFTRLRDGLPSSARVLALVDESAFVQRFGADSPRREERRSAWRRIMAAANTEPVFVDLDPAHGESLEPVLRAAFDMRTGQASSAFPSALAEPTLAQ